MKHLILVLFLIGCGSDDSGNTPTSQETTAAADDAGASEQEMTYEFSHTSADCQANKLCSGMSKKEVLDILPEPTEVMMFTHEERWIYHENTDTQNVCVNSRLVQSAPFPLKLDCYLSFSKKTGTLIKQTRVKTEWLDILHF